MSDLPPASPYLNPQNSGEGLPGHQQPKKSNTLMIVLSIIGGVLLLCCGCCIGSMLFGKNQISAEIQPQVANAPEVQEHIGEIQSFNLDFMKMVKEMQAQGEGAEASFVFDVTGSKGDGQIITVVEPGDDGKQKVKSGKLRLPDGSEDIPLTLE